MCDFVVQDGVAAAVVVVRVRAHPRFERHGAHLVARCSVSLLEALTGFKTVLPTLSGSELQVNCSHYLPPIPLTATPTASLSLSHCLTLPLSYSPTALLPLSLSSLSLHHSPSPHSQIEGTQDKDFSYSFFDSLLTLTLPLLTLTLLLPYSHSPTALLSLSTGERTCWGCRQAW